MKKSIKVLCVRLTAAATFASLLTTAALACGEPAANASVSDGSDPLALALTVLVLVCLTVGSVYQLRHGKKVF